MAGGRGRGRGQGVGLRPEFMGPPPGHGFGFPGPVQPQLYFGYYTYPGAPPPGDYAGVLLGQAYAEKPGLRTIESELHTAWRIKIVV